MTPDYDTSDPLQLLLAEWQQTGWWLWIFLGLATVVLFAAPGTPELALLVAGAGLGQALLKLGSAAIVIANELRKELRASAGPRSVSGSMSAPGAGPGVAPGGDQGARR